MDYRSLSDFNIKNKFSSSHLKIGSVIAAVLVIIYIIFQTTAGRKANLLLSKHDMESFEKDAEDVDFNVNGKIFFFIGKKYGSLDASTITIKIDMHHDSDYKNYKNISYEIDEDFKRLNSYLTGEYFKKPGRYRIRAFLDSTMISAKEITVKN